MLRAVAFVSKILQQNKDGYPPASHSSFTALVWAPSVFQRANFLFFVFRISSGSPFPLFNFRQIRPHAVEEIDSYTHIQAIVRRRITQSTLTSDRRIVSDIE